MLIFLDTETTDVENARVIQLAMLHDDASHPLFPTRYESLFKPPVPISIEAMSVHHVTNEDVEFRDPFESVRGRLEAFLCEPNNVVVAHNAKFDLKALENEGIEVNPRFIDTLKIARYLYPELPKHNLQYLRYWMGLKVEADAHDAMGDMLVLKEVFETMAEKIAERIEHHPKSDESISEMERISKLPVLLHTIRFGKHANKTFEDIAKRDKGYLRWLLNAKTEGGAKDEDEDLIHTLKHYVAT